MLSHANLIVLSLLAGLASPLATRAELYKWVDARGVVNYGDQPPGHAKNVKPLDPDASNLSIVSGIPAQELERKRERDAQARLEQLENEVKALRNRELALARARPIVVEPAEPVEVGYPVYVGYPRYRVHRPVLGVPIRPVDPGYDKRPFRPFFGRPNRPLDAGASHRHQPVASPGKDAVHRSGRP